MFVLTVLIETWIWFVHLFSHLKVAYSVQLNMYKIGRHYSLTGIGNYCLYHRSYYNTYFLKIILFWVTWRTSPHTLWLDSRDSISTWFIDRLEDGKAKIEILPKSQFKDHQHYRPIVIDNGNIVVALSSSPLSSSISSVQLLLPLLTTKYIFNCHRRRHH